MDHPPLVRSYLVVAPSVDMSYGFILLTWQDGWDLMSDIDIDPSSKGPLFGVWIGQNIGFPEWTINLWTAAI